MPTQTDKAKQQADETIERIRSLNEQVLQAGRELGQGFLDAYEQTMRTFADFQQRTAEGTDMQWLSQIAKAQADFTRDVTKYSADAGRRPAPAVGARARTCLCCSSRGPAWRRRRVCGPPGPCEALPRDRAGCGHRSP
jgi:hypothetical protein